MTLPRIITIMGSGETAPTMTKTHRELFSRLGTQARGVILDTPYGFQENASELAQRAVDYFKQSVGHTIDVAGLARLKSADVMINSVDKVTIDSVDEVAIEHGLNRVRESDYVFAGPGSPTYALQQWLGTPLPEILVSKIHNGGIVTFSSAAALTLGRFTVPVYEIYKVGMEPHWLEGLDVLSAIDLKVAIIPHFDNAEGGHHDTRFCYLGQRRLEIMESMLPDDAHVIGIDEHTGLVIDVDEHTATIVGNGTVTVRIRGTSTKHESGTTISLDALREPGSTKVPTPSVAESKLDKAEVAGFGASLAAETESARADFDSALRERDAETAVRAILELETAIHQWSADTLQSDDMDFARATLRSMVVRLGDAALSGLVDPRSVIGPFVESLLDIRAQVRSDKLYALSDQIRDRLIEIGVEVHDTSQGATWELRGTQ
jgi:cyanophycinase-like exopeptidase